MLTCLEGHDDRESYGPANDFIWQSSASLKGVWTWGVSGSYEGSGFVEEFPPLNDPNAREKALNKSKYLSDNDWIDAKTRAVMMEFVAYNPNDNFFLVGTLVKENKKFDI